MFIFLLPHPLAVCGVERPTNRWWTFAAHALLRRGREKRNTLPRAKNPSSHFQNQALSALSAHRVPNFYHADLHWHSPDGRTREALPRSSAQAFSCLTAPAVSSAPRCSGGVLLSQPVTVLLRPGNLPFSKMMPAHVWKGRVWCWGLLRWKRPVRFVSGCYSVQIIRFWLNFANITLIPAWRLFCCKRIITK